MSIGSTHYQTPWYGRYRTHSHSQHEQLYFLPKVLADNAAIDLTTL